MKGFWKRLWTEINLDNLIYNYQAVRASVNPDTLICCVVKANAYGHNAPRVAIELQGAGADWFAVSNVEEAMELRNAGVDRPILILGYTPPECAPMLSENCISQCVYSLEYARELSSAAEKHGMRVSAHIKVDTGMGRIGFSCDARGAEEIIAACALEGISAEGIFTHFAVSDSAEDGEGFTRGQIAKFDLVLGTLKSAGLEFRYIHSANSAAAVDYPEFSMNMVRVGILLYGLLPSAELRNAPRLKPVMALKTVVSHVKTIDKGATVSYGCDFVADSRMTVATVPMGYADGFWRSNRGGGVPLLVHGEKARIIGRICMDQMMLDVSHIGGVRMGDEVTVFGDGGLVCTVDDVAAANNTINYEIICSVGKRVPRVFIKNGCVDSVHLGLLDTTVD